MLSEGFGWFHFPTLFYTRAARLEKRLIDARAWSKDDARRHSSMSGKTDASKEETDATESSQDLHCRHSVHRDRERDRSNLQNISKWEKIRKLLLELWSFRLFNAHVMSHWNYIIPIHDDVGCRTGLAIVFQSSSSKALIASWDMSLYYTHFLIVRARLLGFGPGGYPTHAYLVAPSWRNYS